MPEDGYNKSCETKMPRNFVCFDVLFFYSSVMVTIVAVAVTW